MLSYVFILAVNKHAATVNALSRHFTDYKSTTILTNIHFI